MNKHNPVFSEKYLKKKAVILRNLERYEIKTDKHSSRIPLKLAVAAAICVVLTAAVFASTDLSFFKIFRDNTKTVISVGSTETESKKGAGLLTEKDGYFTFASDFTSEGEIPSLIFHRDYMPASVESEATEGDIKFGDFDSGTALSFSAVYLGGKNYTYNFGSSAKIESFTVNSHSAIIIRLDEATYFNRILAVYFEEYDVLVDCYLGHAIPDSEITKLAEGFRFEKTDDKSLAWQITRNTGGMTHASYLSSQNTYLPLEVTERIELNTTVTLSEGIVGSTERDTVDIEVTPLYTAVFDDILALDEKHCDTENILLFTDSDGEFIPYPRTRVVELTDGSRVFGETKDVRKKLVTVTFSLKNTSDINVVTCIGSAFNLHVGQSKSLSESYVYNKTPNKHTTVPYPFYYDAGGEGRSKWMTEFSAGEEKICTVGFLIDEDMLDISYLLLGNTGESKYNLKLN